MTLLWQMNKGYSLQWVIPSAFEGRLLREFLIDQKISKRTLTSVKFDGGSISVNDTEVNVRHVLEAGDVLKLVFPPEIGSEKLMPENLPLKIVYEDRDVLVVEKPWGMYSIPSKEHSAGTLANRLAGHYETCSLAAAVHIVTRLDRDTSGLVLVAKHRHVHHLFSLQQQEREISRTYEALAEGVMNSIEGVIEQPIGRKDTSIIEREVRHDGQYAKTAYRVLGQYSDTVHLSLRPFTGRTHQIRVHMASIGHPLLGDDLYGGKIKVMERQALHCSTLSFFHPMNNEWMTFESPLASDMRSVLIRLAQKEKRDFPC
ncbi:RluA family pseudouridine synthase [Rossellomorea sp. NS-SX7]|uniref:RluA family pseudouridine synthase n=1 Tax=Rossellomorea sp. NS-SX7 TaxID=3463856 RepID=UPI004058E7B7